MKDAFETSTAKSLSTRACWCIGTLVAFAGTALVRLPAQEHYLMQTLGFLMAGLGLLIIAVGVRNRTLQKK